MNKTGYDDGASADYEKYALSRPEFHAGDRYPAVYADALAGLSGTYADVGAGDGGKLAYSIESGDLRDFETVLAFDISAERVRRISEAAPSVKAAVANAEQLPIADATIDFYFSDQVIEHVQSDQRMAEDIARVLKPGGKALVGSVIKGKGAWYFYRCNGRWVIDPTHLREYASIEDYAAVFQRAGLEVLRTDVTPTTYAVGDMILRMLALTRIYNAEKAAASHKSNWFLSKLGRLRVRIPRYWLCYAVVRRPVI